MLAAIDIVPVGDDLEIAELGGQLGLGDAVD